MPLRLLSYVTDIINLNIVNKDKLFGNTQVKIPTPKFYVMYNGKQSFGSKEQRLSEAFILQDNEPSLELIAKVIDINVGSGETALTRSVTLQGYSLLVDKIRKNESTGMPRDKAIIKAMDSCIDEDVLVEFLTTHYTEVLKMLNWEYDADAVERVIRYEEREEGRKEGLAEGKAEEKILIAQNLLNLDVSIDKIITATGLTKEEIERLSDTH